MPFAPPARSAARCKWSPPWPAMQREAPPCRLPSSSELQLHEDTVRVFAVVAERPAIGKAETCVELLRRNECVWRSGFEAQALVATLARHRDDVRQHRTAGSLPAQ